MRRTSPTLVAINDEIRQLSDPHCQVDALLDQVHDPIERHQRHAHLGVSIEELEDDRRNVQPAEEGRRGDRKQAARRHGLSAGSALRLVDVGKHPAAGGEIAPAGLGQRHGAGRSLQQARPEMLLEGGNRAGHGRGRHMEGARGGGEPAMVGDRLKDPHRLETVHPTIPCLAMLCCQDGSFSRGRARSMVRGEPGCIMRTTHTNEVLMQAATEALMRLHNNVQSGNSYKVRLLLNQLSVRYENVAVDIFAGESRTAEFLAKNPAGQTPVLELDDGTMLPESNAILCYLAEGTDLLPDDPVERGQVLRWMFFEQNAIMPHLGWARFITPLAAGRQPHAGAAAMASGSGRRRTRGDGSLSGGTDLLRR